MPHRFHKHYTREEAVALIPQVRQWLNTLIDARREYERMQTALDPDLHAGRDLGGERVGRLLEALATLRQMLNRFSRHEIQIKDLDRGLLDFPALIGGREVFLCWQKDEDDIQYWHDLESGYAGREPL